MYLARITDRLLVIEGDYDICAMVDGYSPIEESYQLRIEIGRRYPKETPKVFEHGNRIPLDPEHHIFDDKSFCLGSEIKIKGILRRNPSLNDFCERLLTPFLYSVSYKMRFGIWPYGELKHGELGLIDDYEVLFNVHGKQAVLSVLQALGFRKRVANKLPCPCGCGERLGRCDFRFSLRAWREIASREWFRRHLKNRFKSS